jgi:hypothetical protein
MPFAGLDLGVDIGPRLRSVDQHLSLPSYQPVIRPSGLDRSVMQ